MYRKDCAEQTRSFYRRLSTQAISQSYVDHSVLNLEYQYTVKKTKLCPAMEDFGYYFKPWTKVFTKESLWDKNLQKQLY